MNHFDCVIIGAGPAGLLLAKELSKKHNVLVLEKNRVGETNKNWVTYKDRWEKNGFPKSFIESEFKEWLIRTKYGGKRNQFIIKDNFICFNEHKFLNWLAKECKKQGCIIEESSAFISFKREGDSLLVNKKYSTRLLIDCAGINSPIVKKYNLVDLPIYINCYAYLAKFERVSNKNFYCLFRNKKNTHYSSFGFTKVAPRIAQLQYFRYSNKKPNLQKYKEAMERAQRDFDVSEHEVVELKVASYPTGILKKRSLNNILLFGDAGFYSPSLSGMGFNEILRQYQRVSKQISTCINDNLYSEKDLTIPKDLADDIDNLLFRLFGLLINEIPPRVLDDLFAAIGKLSNSRRRRIMRNDVTVKEIRTILKAFIKSININEMIKAVPRTHVEYIVRTLLELGGDILTQEIHNLVFKHHKIKIQDLHR